MKGKTEEGVGAFERYLSIWVLLCMAAGVAVSQLAPAVPAALNRMEVYGQNVPIVALVWVLIFPMMAKVDFAAVRDVGSPVALARTVGALTEVPVMLGLVWAIRATRTSFAVESTLVDARET